MKTLHFLIIFCSLISPPIYLEFSNALDTISSIQSIKDGNSTSTLVSSGQTFELGFFSPVNSKNRYIGIWYTITPNVVVWVANRNNPLNDSFGELTIDNKGNLVLLDPAKSAIWSSNSTRVAKHSVAQLLDTGNLVLRESESISSETYLWQSFDYPSDTLLPGMKLGWDLRTGFERSLTSWKSADDPSNGNFTCRISITGLPEVVIMAGSTRKFATGPWNGVEFSGVSVRPDSFFKPKFVLTENESYSMFETGVDSIHIRATLDYAGQLRCFSLQSGSNEWAVMLSAPYDPCDDYNQCGANAFCSLNEDPMCQCLEGFTPSSPEEWKVANRSNGCVRKTQLDCSRRDGFVKHSDLKLPDLLQFWLNKDMNLEECRNECFKNCSCIAYANSDVRGGGSGCLTWFDKLINVRKLRIKDPEHNIYLRLSASELKSHGHKNMRKRLKITLAASISTGTCILGLLFWCIALKLKKRVEGESNIEDDMVVPMFDWDTIKTATNSFSPENLIGEGGFGLVYKGNLITGQEIAVKRLSKNSRQGTLEFKNEVEIIAKLQHKNLVALLGCCVQGDERMLIYEYMPNKSLDHYIFDKKRRNLSSWEDNFKILMGVARGLLYLHHDSKLPIIHRDLKAGNVLLDSNMNPKISDFGLARIFGGDEKENRTKTIVGTYGYISPEYAFDGIFSVKSDVFSFGVLLLEIVSGKKNRRFSHEDHDHNLLGHAWLLWNKGEASELMDECFKDSGVESQVLRCIHVGLLCVQKHSEDRPTMNSVAVMLSNEEVKLPQQKIPGFFAERSSNNHIGNPTSRTEEFHSENTMTITLDGR